MEWKIIENKLTATYQLDNFSEVIKKLSELAPIADEAEHHPDFNVFGYNKIRFELFTHDANAITAGDYNMAEKIDLLFAK